MGKRTATVPYYVPHERNLAPCGTAKITVGCGCATARSLSCTPPVSGLSRKRLLGEPRSLYASCVMPRLELDPLLASALLELALALLELVPALLGLLHGLIGVGL